MDEELMGPTIISATDHSLATNYKGTAIQVATPPIMNIFSAIETLSAGQLFTFCIGQLFKSKARISEYYKQIFILSRCDTGNNNHAKTSF